MGVDVKRDGKWLGRSERNMTDSRQLLHAMECMANQCIREQLSEVDNKAPVGL